MKNTRIVRVRIIRVGNPSRRRHFLRKIPITTFKTQEIIFENFYFEMGKFVMGQNSFEMG